ncbi:hypothetical protein C8F04DRAFT_1266063 [Mycena alexandri]|uniref:Uncharacterized protein n=1 Tax=Mycena alexandri TaxID=1745969 RepID=A0AAD6SMG6_9AGAR|nr:hypothetical protein C8F04DRAFT_1266063 [Mycena alexandri]
MDDTAAFHTELKKNDCYLGGAKVLDRVVWKKIGSDNAVVLAEDAAAYDAALEEAAEPENGEQPAELPELDSVVFSIVAMIATEDFWLTPCGFWKGPTAYTPAFSDLKLTCRLVAPADPVFAGDFKTVLKNIEKLMARAATAGSTKQGIFGPKESTKASIKLRHVVFEVGAEGEDAEGYQLLDWLVRSIEVQQALQNMDATHRVNVVPAYDVEGNLIPPAQYVSALKGAVVRADMTLLHWHIGRDHRDSYAAEIATIRVLVPPKVAGGTSFSPSPRKRKTTVAATDSGASPGKKSRR